MSWLVRDSLWPLLRLPITYRWWWATDGPHSWLFHVTSADETIEWPSPQLSLFTVKKWIQRWTSFYSMLLFNVAYSSSTTNRVFYSLFFSASLFLPLLFIGLVLFLWITSYQPFNFLNEKIVVFLHGGPLRLCPVIIQMTVGHTAMSSSAVPLQCGCITGPWKAKYLL